MISTKKRFFLLFILMLLLAACSGEEASPQTAAENTAAQPAAPLATSTEEVAADVPTEEPTVVSSTLEPAPTKAIPATEAETAAEEAVPAEPQFNGRYETTYFRGSESAPVTMIDYSDFL